MDWFAKHFDIDIIYLLRHPVPTILSTRKLGWGHKTSSFLDDRDFVRSFLNPARAEYCRTILAQGDPLQLYTLEWCLENLPALRIYRKRPWLTLTYEELVLRPREISRMICSRLGLPDPERMSGQALRPTSTARGSSRGEIRAAGPGNRSGSWLTQVSAVELETVEDILRKFGVKEYEANDAFPADELCHFGPLRNGRGEISHSSQAEQVRLEVPTEIPVKSSAR